MVLAYTDVIDTAEFLLGPAEAPEVTVAKATWNKKKVNLRFQLLSSLGNNSNYINGLNAACMVQAAKKVSEWWRKRVS